jgi:PIN domain nuclease of toxin-antitoxin system
MSRINKAVLDTHAFIWLMQGSKELSRQSIKLIQLYAKNHALYLSAISLWEIAMLEKRGRIILHQPCLQWIEQALNVPGLSVENISPLIAVESSQLPGKFHEDPADRLIVATARALQAVLLTRDSKILNYGQSRYIECVKI